MLAAEPPPGESDEWTEDQDAMMDTDKCFMVKKWKGRKTDKSSIGRLKEVKNILQELSSEQKETHKEMNDHIAFLGGKIL